MTDQPFQDYYPEYFAQCYGCGSLNEHGHQIKSFWIGEETICHFQPKPYHTAIPGYVFLEASLAVLGLGDPTLPTWGKVINDASANGALYKGLYYWVLQPSILLMVAGLGFALLGFSLDRIFNPRLRGI